MPFREFSFVLFDGFLFSCKRVPNTLDEVGIEPAFGIGRLADGSESTATVLGASMVKVEVPIVLLPAFNHSGDVPANLIEPTIDFIFTAVSNNLSCIVFGFEDADPADYDTGRLETELLRGPAITGELAPKVPLLRPTSAER